MTTLPVADARAQFSRLVEEATTTHERFEITRLTTLKGLCKDPRAARSFALFLAEHAREMAEEKKAALCR